MFKNHQTCILILCFSIHVLFLISIFDIYFQSPIVKGIAPVNNDIPASAKRLVLFIADGLRSDVFFELQNNRTIVPYLRDVIERRGRWGVSHTRVPTESRPGHIAIIAGIYEDPSAIFKGWKENPVDFDTVFNKSVTTFGWGSPDIVSMFNKGDTKLKVIMNSYNSELEDFSGGKENAVLSSLWPLEKFKSFLKDAKNDDNLHKKLNQEKIIFFFHLLGIDTAGHSHKPYSEEYENNIRVADDIVREVEILLNRFYDNDDKTSYIFTSDHGMTDWGSHGEGSPAETETPFVAWGAGINKPLVVERNINSPENWHLSYLRRNDINQADITPLMSVLLGIPIPVNSVGTLPLDILNFPNAEKSRIILLNARQILAQFLQKKDMVEKETFKWLYKSYETFSGEANSKLIEIYARLHEEAFEEVVEESLELITYSLTGLHYYHNYYQRLLLTCIAVAYVGWIIWLMLNVSDDASHSVLLLKSNRQFDFQRKQLLILDVLFVCSLLIILFILLAQFLPFRYYLYCCLPFVIWWNVLRRLIIFKTIFVRSTMVFACIRVFFMAANYAQVVAFFDRRALSLTLLLLSFWPFFSEVSRSHGVISYTWFISCVSLMIFPFLPIMKSKSNDIYLFSCFLLWSAVIVISRYYMSVFHFSIFSTRPKKIFIVPLILLLVSTIDVLFVSSRYSRHLGLPTVNKLLSWGLFFCVPWIPLMYSRKLLVRLLNIYFTLGSVSILFSLTYDSLFLPLFCINLLLWLVMENKAENNTSDLEVSRLFSIKFYRKIEYKNRQLVSKDFRTAYFFFFYIMLSFFGAGNLASINSFDTRWVRCFVTIFSPFTMMILILVKMMIPFVVTTCTFRAINTVTKAPVNKIFCIVLTYCDLMGLNFLFMVKNVGSWLQIGSSVSHYIISQSIILFLVFLYFIAGFFTSYKLKFVCGRSRYFKFRYAD